MLIITDDDRVYELVDNELRYSSIQESWTYPNETAVKISDTGNGFKVKFHDRQTIKMDYSEMESLIILIKELFPNYLGYDVYGKLTE